MKSNESCHLIKMPFRIILVHCFFEALQIVFNIFNFHLTQSSFSLCTFVDNLILFDNN